ncbi:MAG: type II secretion system F family protein [Eubacteriales bacterium]
MAKYLYKAVSADGRNMQGVIEAETVDSFKAQLKQAGLFCLSYTLEENASAAGSIFAGKIPLKELSIICRQFAAMLNAGVSVVKCLDVLCQQTASARVKSVLDTVMQDVRKGSSLHQAMSKQGSAFPFYLISSVESGEESGTLDSVMNRMAEYFEKQYKTAASIRASLTYPIILAILCVVVVIGMLTFVVPKFIGMFAASSSALPMPTQVLIGISDFILNQWYIVALVVGAVVAGIFLLKRMPSTRTAWDSGMLKIPIFGKMRRTVLTAKFAHTLSTLTTSGISMLVALEVVSRVIGNWYIAHCIAIIIEDLKKGLTLSQSMRKFDVFPPMFKSMVAIGEESGQIDTLLAKTAAFYDDEADLAVKRMVSMVEPLMIIIMAVIIGFIVVAIILPIYTMYQNMYT